MGVKRKYQGPPYIIANTELAASRPMSVGMMRQLGIMSLQLEDEMPPKGLNPLPYLEMHNLKATEKWLFVHIPNADLKEITIPSDFVDLDISGQHTDRYDWSFVSELNRVGKPKPIEKSSESLSKTGSECDAEAYSETAELKSSDTVVPDFRCTLESLCSSREELEAQGYPREGVKLDQIEGSREGYAIDCEMCMSGTRQVLTRIAVVQFSDGAKLFDELVKPVEQITDYVTKYSGITGEMLAEVTLTLTDVHKWLRDRIGSTDVLIGHSLNNDLNVLEITHPRIVDTALCFPHYLGPSYHSSLRYLSRKFLNHEIQTGGDSDGHDPVEDATTCEKLIKWLMVHGTAFTKIDTSTTQALSTKLTGLDIRSTIIDSELPAYDADGTASQFIAKDAESGVDLSLRGLKSSQYVCVTLPHSPSLSEDLARLVTSAPPRTLIMLCLGTAYSLREKIQELRARKARFGKEFRTKKWDEIKDPWTTEDDAILKNTTRELGAGKLFLQVTLSPGSTEQWPESVKRKYHAKAG